jgi:hypothetical protein
VGAYKYDAGLRNVSIAGSSRVGWRDTANAWKEYLLNGLVDQHDVALKTNGRIVVADRGAADRLRSFRRRTISSGRARSREPRLQLLPQGH